MASLAFVAVHTVHTGYFKQWGLAKRTREEGQWSAEVLKEAEKRERRSLGLPEENAEEEEGVEEEDEE